MKTIFKTLFILVGLSISSNAQSVFSTTNGKYNKAISVKINGQNAELKPISCGLMHIARKDKKTGETKIKDKITVMFLDKYDGSLMLTIDFKDKNPAIGKFPNGEERRPFGESDHSLSEGDPNKYVFPRPHVEGNFYPNKQNPDNPYQGSMYNVVFDEGELVLTRLDLAAHRISFQYSGSVKPSFGKGEKVEIKGLELNDMPLAEMNANDMGMPTKVIYQEKF